MALGRDPGPVAAAAGADLRERIAVALARAERSRRPVIASHTVACDEALDVAASVFASRVAEERYFVWEQPERGFALGALGAVWLVEGVPDRDRFRAAAFRCAEVARDAVADAARPGTGPVWVGGFAFDGDGGASPHWSSLPPTLLMLPALSLCRDGSEVHATANVVCRAGDDEERLARAAEARLSSLRAGTIAVADPDPLGGYEIESALPPEHYVRAVAEARRRIRDGELEKVVLAREVTVSGSAPFRPATIFDGLRSAYPTCFCFCVGTADAAFVGASPELLVRRAGARVATVAMAGSTRRSADPAIDDHLGQRLLHDAKEREEHAIVAHRIERALAPISVWVAAEQEPSLIKVANIQHLATPIAAQLAEPLGAVELAGVLHPTPAVGGEPWPRARDVMALEGLDRGWYAAPVGWMDGAEDGEFCVALRCALIEGRSARCYAGVGVVANSDPEAELAETEVKLQALLTVLTQT